jgi:hypothetical protein
MREQPAESELSHPKPAPSVRVRQEPITESTIHPELLTLPNQKGGARWMAKFASAGLAVVGLAEIMLLVWRFENRPMPSARQSVAIPYETSAQRKLLPREVIPEISANERTVPRTASMSSPEPNLWLARPLYGNNLEDAALDKVTITKRGDVYRLSMPANIAISCNLYFNQAGNPSSLPIANLSDRTCRTPNSGQSSIR